MNNYEKQVDVTNSLIFLIYYHIFQQWKNNIREYCKKINDNNILERLDAINFDIYTNCLDSRLSLYYGYTCMQESEDIIYLATESIEKSYRLLLQNIKEIED